MRELENERSQGRKYEMKGGGNEKVINLSYDTV